MGWADYNARRKDQGLPVRKDRLPVDWPQIRARVLERDGHRCTATMKSGPNAGGRCWDKATDVDHIMENDDDSDENLQSLCSWHHNRKTSKYGGQRAAEQRKEKEKLLKRPPTKHPGLI